MEIADALKRLDPDNDAQWTTTGEPRMDAVEGIIGDTSITRADLKKAAPKFTREAARAARKEETNVADAKPVGMTVKPQVPDVTGAPAYHPNKVDATGARTVAERGDGKWLREELAGGVVAFTRVDGPKT